MAAAAYRRLMSGLNRHGPASDLAVEDPGLRFERVRVLVPEAVCRQAEVDARALPGGRLRKDHDGVQGQAGIDIGDPAGVRDRDHIAPDRSFAGPRDDRCPRSTEGFRDRGGAQRGVRGVGRVHLDDQQTAPGVGWFEGVAAGRFQRGRSEHLDHSHGEGAEVDLVSQLQRVGRRSGCGAQPPKGAVARTRSARMRGPTTRPRVSCRGSAPRRGTIRRGNGIPADPRLGLRGPDVMGSTPRGVLLRARAWQDMRTPDPASHNERCGRRCPPC